MRPANIPRLRVVGSDRHPERVEVVHVRDVRTRSGRWWCAHERALRAVAGVALAWTAIYLVWRVGWSWTGVNPILWVGLLVCELFGFASLALLTWFSWSEARPARPIARRPHTVDVYVCTYDEPLDVLRPTLLGCRALNHPHTTWLLDDGRRPEVRRLAEQLGVRYLTRPTNEHAKAGNINHALAKTHGELVLILDADHVPMPDALDAMVGYFDDDRTALVQSPHDFLNHDSFQHYSPGRHEQSVFFEVVCPGKDRHGAAFWCGSAALVRRAALLAAGGVATETIAEDFHTTIKLQRLGWTTHYHHETLVQGLAPHDLSSYLLQRDRWARGNLAVLRTPESPLRAEQLTARQRLSYGASLFAYLAGPVRALLLAVLAATLWTGRLPLRADATILLALWLPATALSMLAGSALARGYMQIKESVHFELLTAWTHLRALRSVISPKTLRFKVTPKEGVDRGGWASLRQLPLLVGLAALLTAGALGRLATTLGLAPLPAMPGLAGWVVTALGIVEARRVLRSLWWVAHHRQRRLVRRFAASRPAIVTDAEGISSRATLADVSTFGIGLIVPHPLEPGARVTVTTTLPAPDGRYNAVRLAGTVTNLRAKHHRNHVVGVRIVDISESSANAIAEYSHVVVLYDELRAVHPAAPVSTAATLDPAA
jgi:cellulose synthase (UDP-forming)